MNVSSMTAFGRGEAPHAGGRVVAEVRSVNGRFLDVAVRLPEPDAALEDAVRRRVSAALRRGRVEVRVAAEGASAAGRLKVDSELASAYYHSLKDLAERLGIEEEVELETLAELPGVFTFDSSAGDAAWREAVLAAVDMAIGQCNAMRAREGSELAADMLGRLVVVGELVERMAARAPAVVEEYAERLRQRVAGLREALQPGAGVPWPDEARLAAEVAILAERSDISEEAVRLRSHVAQSRRLLTSGGAVGREMEFLLQEIHREINTIGAKTGDLEIARLVIQAKAEVERLREQAQNVE